MERSGTLGEYVRLEKGKEKYHMAMINHHVFPSKQGEYTKGSFDIALRLQAAESIIIEESNGDEASFERTLPVIYTPSIQGIQSSIDTCEIRIKNMQKGPTVYPLTARVK